MASSNNEDSSSSNYHSFPTRSVSFSQPSTVSDPELTPEEKLDQTWLQKHPAKTSVVVRIGGIINPAQFWVRELPISKNQRRESVGIHAEIFRFERGLASRYNVEPKANPDNLVAVRPSHISPHWYRGR